MVGMFGSINSSIRDGNRFHGLDFGSLSNTFHCSYGQSEGETEADEIFVVFVECIRFLPVWYKLKRSQRRAHIDVVNPVPLQQIYGEQKTKHVKKELTSFDRE